MQSTRDLTQPHTHLLGTKVEVNDDVERLQHHANGVDENQRPVAFEEPVAEPAQVAEGEREEEGTVHIRLTKDSHSWTEHQLQKAKHTVSLTAPYRVCVCRGSNLESST